jgi:hypothetical protein
MEYLMRRDLAWFTAVALILLPAAATAQQTRWPDPPAAATAPPPTDPAATKPARKPRQKPAAAQGQTDPRLEQEPAAAGAAAPRARPAARPAAALNVLCDGAFGKDSTHDRLVKAYGERNVVAQGSTILFPTDAKRRLEVTWHDSAGRSRPATIVVEAQSTWRVRGFRLGDALARVEKVNGKPFRLAGFDGDSPGAVRNWEDGKLDTLSGGCQLGMRFAPGPKTPPPARAKLASGEFSSDSPDVKAAKPTIVELIVAYPE